MSNGKMTFRFDVEKYKPINEEQWTGGEHLIPPIDDEEDSWFRDRQIEHAPTKMIYDMVDVPHMDESYSGGIYHSRRSFNGWKFAASVTAAIGVGLLFGYVALSFFRGGDLLPVSSVSGVSNQAVTDGQNAGIAVDPAGTGTSGLPIAGTDNGGSLPKIPVQIAGQSYYLLQYGVFSTPEGASQAKQELLTAGFAAGLDPTDGNRVFAGVSPDREQAKLLSNGLKAQGIELYVKEVAIPATTQLSYGGTADTVNNYFAVSGKILGELSSLSASLLSNSTTAAKVEDVSSLHMEWTEAVKALETGSSSSALKIIASQEKIVNQGISALNEYNKNKSDGLLWEVQGAMMNFLTGQKELLSSYN